MANSSKAVEGYIRKNKQWSESLEALRAMLVSVPLTEEIKWRAPCYSAHGQNLVIIGAHNDWCALSFLQGALLKDKSKILEELGPNTRSARVVRFTSLDEVKKKLPTLKAYVLEAIELAQTGVRFDFAATRSMDLPDELVAIFNEMPDFKKAFEALTPGRQRGWLIHFTGAKQSATRTSRIEKAMQTIFDGKGPLDASLEKRKACRRDE